MSFKKIIERCDRSLFAKIFALHENTGRAPNLWFLEKHGIKSRILQETNHISSVFIFHPLDWSLWSDDSIFSTASHNKPNKTNFLNFFFYKKFFFCKNFLIFLIIRFILVAGFAFYKIWNFFFGGGGEYVFFEKNLTPSAGL